MIAVLSLVSIKNAVIAVIALIGVIALLALYGCARRLLTDAGAQHYTKWSKRVVFAWLFWTRSGLTHQFVATGNRFAITAP